MSGFHVKLMNVYQFFFFIITCKNKFQTNALVIIFGAFILEHVSEIIADICNNYYITISCPPCNNSNKRNNYSNKRI